MKKRISRSPRLLVVFLVMEFLLLVGCLKQPYVKDGFTATGTTLDYKETEYYDGFIWSNWEYTAFIPLVEVYIHPKNTFFNQLSYRPVFDNKADRLLFNKYHKRFDKYSYVTRIKFKGKMSSPSGDLHNIGTVEIEKLYYLESITPEKLEKVIQQLNTKYGSLKMKE